MTTTICLLRGINVGGRNILPMAHLRDILTGLGATGVQTYIQSGNAVFSGALDPATIQAAISRETGLSPQVMTYEAAEFDRILAANPFEPPDKTHLYFLGATPKPLNDTVLALATPSEAVTVTPKAAYLNAPEGIGRSKLAAKLESALGVPATARNWRSCLAIQALHQKVT